MHPLRHGMPVLIPTELAQHPRDQALPHDLFNQQGILVASAGSLIADPARWARLAEMRLFRQGNGQEEEHISPVDTLLELGRRYDALLEDELLDAGALAHTADRLHQLAALHPEACIGMTCHLVELSQAKRHALFVAAVGVLTARAMMLDEAAQRTIARAALAMNLASHALQDTLLRYARQPTETEREQLRLHPWHAAEALTRVGVTDSAWLQAVNQHHENLDGSGYPFGIHGDAITQEARILRVVDVFGALMSHRHTRTGHYAHQAMRVAFDRERGRLDDASMLALRRVIGHYPPGTLVRLTNRETAIVTRWFRSASQPKFVVSLLRPSGDPLHQPQKRNTAAHLHTIREYTYLPMNHPPLDWTRIWAQG
ncbi:MAG: hypothetical protein HZB71_02685 [Betaproteobacteria bacterium]|nr:hypothetical protein [Betaproteobacteria bacterium]